jgi:hypothetical protein
MKLSQLTAKPQLVEFKLEDEDTIAKYGEAVTFYSWDRQPMDTFMRLAQATDGNTKEIITIVKDLILDEDGKQIISEDNMLPTDVLMKAIGVITQKLGG